jgi:hypothetical protein
MNTENKLTPAHLYWPLRFAQNAAPPNALDKLYESILRELGETDTIHSHGEEQPTWGNESAP